MTYMMRFYSLLLLFLTPFAGAVAQQGEVFIDSALPEGWNNGDCFDQTMPPDDEWWLNFEDPVLDSLILYASENSYSVLGAMENIRKARAAWNIARGKMLPTFDIGMG
jgi:outer membrane protein TolC